METKRLSKFIILAFTITWILWWGVAILVQSTAMRANDWLTMILFTIGGFGPAIAALFCLDSKLSVNNLLSFVFNCDKKSALVLVLFIVLELITFGFSSMELNRQISPTLIPLIIVQAVTIYGGSEELGWRGIMQAILQKKLPYPIATLIVGVVWSIWHIPLWFIEGNSHQSSSFVVFAILAVLLTFGYQQLSIVEVVYFSV